MANYWKWKNFLNFQRHALTLTLDPAIRQTVVHHSSTSTYITNFIQIEETFCGRTGVPTYMYTSIRPQLLDIKAGFITPHSVST